MVGVKWLSFCTSPLPALSSESHISLLDLKREASKTTTSRLADNMTSNTIYQRQYTTASNINRHHKTAQTSPPSHSKRHFQVLTYFLYVPSRVQQAYFKQKPITSDDVMLDVSSSRIKALARHTTPCLVSICVRHSTQCASRASTPLGSYSTHRSKHVTPH